MENVPELEKEKVFKDFVSTLEGLNYIVNYQVVMLHYAWCWQGDAEKRLFFTPAWYVVFVVEVAVYLILQLRERQERSDRLESGRVFRTVVGLAVTVSVLHGFLAVCWWRDICPAVIKCWEAANGRLALWKVTNLTYGKEGLLFQIFVGGPGP